MCSRVRSRGIADSPGWQSPSLDSGTQTRSAQASIARAEVAGFLRQAFQFRESALPSCACLFCRDCGNAEMHDPMTSGQDLRCNLCLPFGHLIEASNSADVHGVGSELSD